MAGNLFDENSAASARDPLRWCKAGQHQLKVFNKVTGEKVCTVCKKTISDKEGAEDEKQSRDKAG